MNEEPLSPACYGHLAVVRSMTNGMLNMRKLPLHAMLAWSMQRENDVK